MTDMLAFGKQIREEFSLKEGISFLNHGAFGAVPRYVQNAQERVMKEMNNCPDVWFRTACEIRWKNGRDAIAVFVNSDPEDIVFVQNATTGINTVLRSLHYEPGDIILFTDKAYIGVQLTCRKMALTLDNKGVKADVITLTLPINSEDDIMEMYEAYFKLYPNVKVAVIDHITCFTAIKMPIERLVALCKKYKVLSLVDGAHVPGQVLLNLKDIDADFYTGNLHKWLYTPRGCGILYVNKRHRRLISPVVTSIGHNQGLTMSFIRQGTRDDSAYCVVPEAIQFYQRIGGIERITNYIQNLLRTATSILSTSWGTESLPIPASMKAPCMTVIRVPNFRGLTHVNDEIEMKRLLYQSCEKHNVISSFMVVDRSMYCRLCANVYNTISDFHNLDRAVLELIKPANDFNSRL